MNIFWISMKKSQIFPKYSNYLVLKKTKISRIAVVIVGFSVLGLLVMLNISIAFALNPQLGSTPTCILANTDGTSISINCSGNIIGLEGLSRANINLVIINYESGCKNPAGYKVPHFTQQRSPLAGTSVPVSDGQASFSIQAIITIPPSNCPQSMTPYFSITYLAITVLDSIGLMLAEFPIPGPYTITG